MGFISQPYPNTDLGSRLIFVGGYGGLVDLQNTKFDGLRSRGDIWTTENGRNWTLLTSSSNLGEIAWFGFSVWEPPSSIYTSTPRLWVVGGGYIGANKNNRVSSMIGSTSVYWSSDGISWTQVNFVSGGGKSTLARYSSSEWAKTTIDGDVTYLGLWGPTVEVMTIDGVQKIYLIGGDQDGQGTYLAEVYEGQVGLLCDVEGMICNGK
jgi:hypothetical protein